MFTNVRIWRPIVRQICLDAGVTEAVAIEGTFPGTSAVFIVDQKAVVKIFPPFLPGEFEREVEAYALIDRRLDPYLPRLLAEGVFVDQVDWRYIIVEYRAGTPIREVRSTLAPSALQVIARELGWQIRALHDTPLDGAAFLDPGLGAWTDFVTERRRAVTGELSSSTTLPIGVLAEIDQFLAGARLETDSTYRPVLLNGDLTEDHLILEKTLGRWRVSALIDWGDARIGPAEYEWVALWFGLCDMNPGMFREVLYAYDPAIQLDADFRQEMLAFTLVHQFGSLIIGETLTRLGGGGKAITTLKQLQGWLWPAFRT